MPKRILAGVALAFVTTLAFALSACAGSVLPPQVGARPADIPISLQVEDTGTPEPVSSETPALQGVAELPVPSSTATSFPTPTDTPTRTPTPSPTAAQTLTATPMPTPTRIRTPTATRTPTTKPTTTPYAVPSGTMTRLDRTFHSASLQMDREVIVYLPPGYDATPERRYPVLYLLHGYGGFTLQHTTEWEQWGLENVAQEQILKSAVRPMIIVQPLAFMPDGECSLFFNHGPGTDGKPWGDYIWKDVVTYIDSNFRTLARRESRAIGGFSFGGQGALSLALLHPETFTAVGAHSPSFRSVDGSIGFINDWNYFNQYDPIWLVQNKNTAAMLAIWLDVAAGDDQVRACGAGSDRCVEAFHALLHAKSIPHEWHDAWPGPHDGSYWIAHTPDYLAWYSSKLLGE